MHIFSGGGDSHYGSSRHFGPSARKAKFGHLTNDSLRRASLNLFAFSISNFEIGRQKTKPKNRSTHLSIEALAQVRLHGVGAPGLREQGENRANIRLKEKFRRAMLYF